MGEKIRRGRSDGRRVSDSQGGGSPLTWRSSDARGQAHVLGFVLLIGAVTVASVGIVVFGSDSLDAQQTTIETEYAEQSMVEFTHATATTRFADRESSAVSVGAFDRGHVEMRDDGHVRITHVTENSTEVLHEESLGTLAYVNSETEIGYQGGGLWRSNGDGTVSLSAPSVEFRDGAFRFPIVHLNGDEFRSDSFDGTVGQSETPISVEPVERGTSGRAYAVGDVRVEIESEYCDGWEREIDETISGSVIERCSDGQPNRLRFELDVPPRITNVDSTVIADEIDVHENAPNIDGDVRTGSVDADKVDGTVFDEGYDRSSVDDQIDSAIAECDGEFDDLDDRITEPGRYCTDTLDGTHEFDTSNGDIDVVVRDSIGDPNYQDDLLVEGENEVTIFVDGDLHARGDAQIGNESDPSQMRLLFSSDSNVKTSNGGPEISALIYAPDSDVTFQGSPTVEGTVVGERVEIENINPGGVSYHESVEEIDYRPGTGPQLRYAQITAYEVAIDE